MIFTNLIFPFLVSFSISMILFPLVIKIAYKFKLVDDPKKHKHPAIIHTKPIPRMGGLPIYLAVLFTSVIFIPMDKIFVSILFSGAIVTLIGVLDDKYDLSPYLRFFANIACAILVVAQGVYIPFVTNPFGGIVSFNSFYFRFFNFDLLLGGIFAVVWIVWVMNMLNWSKGVDGQMPGIAVISAIVIGIASTRFQHLEQINVHSAEMSFIVAGAALGLLFFNYHPAKIFPGYSATILGFTIAILSILSGVKLATAILVMGVPTIDAVATIIRRTLSKKSPFWHDRGHLHHLLLSLGFGQRSIAFFYWVMSGVLGIIALNLSSKGKLFAIILLVVLVGALIFSLRLIIGKKFMSE